MDHPLPTILCGSTVVGIVTTLALAGLVGSAAHCVGMCGPFVLAQHQAQSGEPVLLRLVRGATLPYHLGRLTTYTLLGAMFGGASHGLSALAPLAPVRNVLLFGAAALFLLQALRGFGLRPATPRWSNRLCGTVVRLTAPILRHRFLRQRGLAGYGLGVVLGFLPCGFLYGALFAAAGTGSATGGGLAMAAFAAGTMPSLMLLGCGAATLARGGRRWAVRLLPTAQAAAALSLVLFAL